MSPQIPCLYSQETHAIVPSISQNEDPAVPIATEALDTKVLRLGIAITTYNRREMVINQIAKIRELTTSSFELVICDDGSTDGTRELLEAQKEHVVTGANLGIAWNKNRGIFYLLHVMCCDVILLLDDDILPINVGWEREWIDAATRWGHVNQAHPAFRNTIVSGRLTAAEPGLASMIPGWALAFSRTAIAEIGYFDLRFGRYGHEHSDMSFRALRAGHGGITISDSNAPRALFYVIDGGLEGVTSVTSGTNADLEKNAKLLTLLGKDQIYRHAWRNDSERELFLSEVKQSVPSTAKVAFGRQNCFSSIEDYRLSISRLVPLPTLSNLAEWEPFGVTRFSKWSIQATESLAPLPLLPGTDEYAHNWIKNWHDSGRSKKLSEVTCYSATDAVVSGDGQIWIEGRLVTSPEVMPNYVANGLELEKGGSERLHKDRELAVRTIDNPCLIAIGHGSRVYGHFLIEMLFRILIAKETIRDTDLRYRVLLDQETPLWLLYILDSYLGVRLGDIEFFQPKTEHVCLKHAIIPTRIFQEEGFHPAANVMLDRFVSGFPASDSQYRSRRFFILRNKFSNPSAPQRFCMNEARLAEIAIRDHGFVPITIENMEWREQIEIFRTAEILLGQAGSGLHNALFSSPGSKLASIGFMNMTQSNISSLRQQNMAYFTRGVDLKGEFSVDEDLFKDFLDQVCR